MTANNITTYPALENYWEDRLLEIIHNLNHSYVVWEEIFNNGLHIAPETIVHVWKPRRWDNELAKVVKSGFRAIISSPWYLDIITFSMDWKRYYAVEPLDIPASEEEKKLVIGGEACLWGEYEDATNIMPRAFPRSSAVGERLWSAAKVRDVKDMEERLNKHRCGMCAREIPASTDITRGFCPVEYKGFDRVWEMHMDA